MFCATFTMSISGKTYLFGVGSITSSESVQLPFVIDFFVCNDCGRVIGSAERMT